MSEKRCHLFGTAPLTWYRIGDRLLSTPRANPSRPDDGEDQMSQPANPSYFVVMIDYNRRGLEAIVDPEITERGVVARLTSGEYTNVAYIHHVQDGSVVDVTDDLFAKAGVGVLEEV